MPSEEGKQILKLLADGKIDTEQAYRLLRALGDIDEGPRRHPGSPPGVPPPPPGPGGRGRILHLDASFHQQRAIGPLQPWHGL